MDELLDQAQQKPHKGRTVIRTKLPATLFGCFDAVLLLASLRFACIKEHGRQRLARGRDLRFICARVCVLGMISLREKATARMCLVDSNARKVDRGLSILELTERYSIYPCVDNSGKESPSVSVHHKLLRSRSPAPRWTDRSFGVLTAVVPFS